MDRASSTAVLREVLAGSDAALDTLYERYGPRLLSFIRLKMGRGLRARLESRDILQATFLKSFQHLDDDWLDRSVAWFAERGRHPYLLIEDWEIPMFQRQFAGQEKLANLAAPPVFMYEGAARVALFDLQSLRPPTAAVDRIVETYNSVRCEAPAPPLAVNFAR